MNRHRYNNKKTISIEDTFRNIASTISALYVFVILVIFPLYTHDKYFDILGARYVFFKVATVFTLFCLIALGIIYIVIDSKSMMHEEKTLVRFVNAFKIENLHKYVNICDLIFLIMIISMTISTIGAHKTKTFDLLTEAFYGNAGRYQGLECWIIYFVMYICISRTYRFKKWHLDFAIFSCAFASIWCLTDFFMMDIFGFLQNVSELQKHQFSSSIGNLNTLTNYTCMGFALAITLFVTEKNIYKMIYYAIGAICCLIACIIGISDNAAIGVGIVYVCIPFFAIKDRRNLIQYVFAIAILFLGFNLGYIIRHTEGAAGGWAISSVFFDLCEISFVRYMLYVFLAIGIALFVFYRKKKLTSEEAIVYSSPYDVKVHNLFVKIWGALVMLGFLFIVYVFYDVNVSHNLGDKLVNLFGPMKNFLVFNDDWGTHRGHNWRIAFTNFASFNPFHKLFGYGPDTYLVITERTFYEEMVNRYGEVYDSAHNEYINYLICEGAVGLLAYLGIIVSNIVYGAKKLKSNIFISACIIAVISYAVQAVVNIAIPITTPIYFALMFMLMAEYMVKKEIDE